MATKNNTFEGGSDETTLTAGVGGNTGGASGDFFDTISLTGTSTLVFDTARAAHGSVSCRVDAGADNRASAYWDISATTFYGRIYCYFTANPPGNATLVRFWNTTEDGEILLLTTGKIRLDSASTTNVVQSTNTAPLNQWFRLEFKFVVSATVGSLDVKLFFDADYDAVSPTETVSYASQDTGTAIMEIRWGQGNAVAADLDAWWMDDVNWNDVDYPGPAVTARPVTVGAQAGVSLAASGSATFGAAEA